MRGRTEALVVIGVTLVLVGGLFFFFRQQSAERAATGPGRLESRVVVDGLLMTLESVHFSSEDNDYDRYRARAWNALTGARVGQAEDVTWRSCRPARGSRLWCLDEQAQVQLVGVPAFETVATFATLEQKAGQKLLDASALSVHGGALEVTLSDGKLMALDPDTLALVARAAPEVMPNREGPALEACPLPETRRVGLCRDVYGPNPTRVDSGEGFLSPEVLGRGPAGWLVLNTSSLDPSTAQLELVWLDDAFKETRRLTLGPTGGWSSGARDWLDERKLLLLTHAEAGNTFTVAIDLVQGQQRWRVAH